MDSLIGGVPDHWPQRQLAEVCDVLAGPSAEQVKLTARGSTDVPVVTPRDLRHNRIAYDCGWGTAPDAASELSRYRLRPDDIVCARTGQLGRQALVGADQDGWLIGSACLRLRVRQMISPAYLVYYLGHPAVRHWIDRNTSGAVIPSLSVKTLGSLPVVIPPAAVQADTAEVLGALDDKITVYEQIISTTASLRDAVLFQLLAGNSEV